MADIPVKRGITLKARWEVRNRETKALIDVRTGYTPKCYVKSGSGTGAILLELDEGAGLRLGNGYVELVLTDVQTRTLAAGFSRAWYQVTLKNESTTDVDEIDSGKLVFSG